MRSNDVRDTTRELAEALFPWPITNEEAWDIIDAHLTKAWDAGYWAGLNAEPVAETIFEEDYTCTDIDI